MMEAYFDESGTHEGSYAVCVAGYLFEKEKRIKLDSLWKAMLDYYDLPYFHMIDCAHGTPPFRALNKNKRIEAAKQAIHLIKSHSAAGFAVGVPD
jgi:hypothetical protein